LFKKILLIKIVKKLLKLLKLTFEQRQTTHVTTFGLSKGTTQTKRNTQRSHKLY
jgi:hypothetical protein